MRVLWFTNTPPAEANGKLKYNGGGWVSSLKDLMSMRTSLGIAFVSKSGWNIIPFSIPTKRAVLGVSGNFSEEV